MGVDYYPFGLAFNSWIGTSNTRENLYKFNGVEEQKELGLNMTMFRLYDPSIARFTAVDPLADFLPGINPYQFGFNNPINFSDPDGLAPKWWTKLRAIGNLIGNRLKGSMAAGVATDNGNGKNAGYTYQTGGHNRGSKSSGGSSSSTPPTINPPSSQFASLDPQRSSMPGLKPVNAPENPNPIIPDSKPKVVKTREDDQFVSGSVVNISGNVFPKNSSFEKRKVLLQYITPISRALKYNSAMRVVLTVATNAVSKDERGRTKYINPKSKYTLGELLDERSKAILRAMKDLGVDIDNQVEVRTLEDHENIMSIEVR